MSRYLPVLLIGFILGGLVVSAQVSTRTISGVVQDQTGAVIAGAMVTVRNVDTGAVPMASEVPAAFRSQCVSFTAVPGSCSNLLGNAGRNSIIGPNLYNVDFSVHKSCAVRKISDAFNVQFRAEFFNVLNHANFQVPLDFSGGSNAVILNSDGTSAHSGGLEQPQLVLPRDIQFALKVIF